MSTSEKPTPYMAKKAKATPPPSYWTTNHGRNVIGVVAAVGGAVYFGGHTVLHTFFLDKYRDAMQLYKHGFPTPLSPATLTRCRSVVADLNVKLKTPDSVGFFCVLGMDMFHAGSLKLRGGSIVGVPRHFSYEAQEQIERNDIMVENKPVEWGSDGAQLLKDSLILSERAQKFAIAREIVMTNNHAPYIHGGLGASAIFAYFCTTRTLNEKLYGLARPKSFRVFMYSLVGSFAFGLWATATDILTKRYERKADERVGGMGIEYAKGGVEFYAKTLERNMALRSLMGPKGEKMFTFYGNDVEFIRQQHIPYTERKRNLEVIAENLSKVNVAEENPYA
ncbi:Transmembrane protein [Orchesella cincta]|uniref:Transmembrane protein n=1 Tax=Orchesella cincta TaxID=48709 RepID=A0A1D2NKS0_ORCCI|nr:Transmembrane protein [Orchesella cincta]